MIRSRAVKFWHVFDTATRTRAPAIAYSRTRQDQPRTESGQFRGITAGGGRSRVRTWEGLADGFTDLWRNRSDLRERQVPRLFRHALGTVPPLRAVPRALPAGNFTTQQSWRDRDLDSLLTGELRPRDTCPPR